MLFSLRVSAGMMNLWGTNNPAKWLNESEKEFAREARFLLFAAIAKVRVKEMQRAGITRVEVLSGSHDDVCAVCRNADRNTYDIGSALELPHENCTCELGCACLLVATQ
jgi:hypothetical protein